MPGNLTHGVPLTSVDLDHFTLTEVRYGRGDCYAAHSHDRAYVLLLIEGGFHEEAAADAHFATSGSVLLMPADCRHVNRIADDGARGLLVTLQTSLPRRITRFRGFYRGVVPQSMVELYRHFRSGGSAESFALEEHLLHAIDLASGLEERDGAEASLVRQARGLLEDASAAPLRLSAVAAAVGVTPAYLARAFRGATGTTMSDYLRSVRARKAVAMLASEEIPLAEVALRTGFADQSHLTRVVKSEFGITPAEYRRLARP